MKKIIIFIVILIVLVGGFYLYKNEAKAPSEIGNNQSNSQITPTPSSAEATPAIQTNVKGSTGTDYTPPQSGGGENTGSNVQVTEVDFDGTKFSPSPATINLNDWIFFKNKSETNIWVISNPGLTPSDQPKLDSLKPLQPGGEYKFQFTSPGVYIYEDKLNPPPSGWGGTVVVSK